MNKLLYVLGCMLVAVTVQAQNNEKPRQPVYENSLLWEVSGNGLAAPSYVFGTFHLMCKEDIRLGETLQQSVKNSREVYLELDLDDPSTLMGAMMLMNMKGGKKLKDLYTEAEYKRIADFFKDSLHTPIGLFQSMKPEFLAALLYPKMMPCNSTASIEESIMQLAKADGKEVKGLETMAFQASVFDSIPYEKQARELLQGIDSIAQSKKYFARMLDAYKAQRLDQIEQIVQDTAYGEMENQDVLLDKRNKNWVLQLKEIMKKEPVFVAVGAGHLVRQQGLIALLRKEGYTVKALKND